MICELLDLVLLSVIANALELINKLDIMYLLYCTYIYLNSDVGNTLSTLVNL